MKPTDAAFPLSWDNQQQGQGGMTLLHYFMAHAPKAPQWYMAQGPGDPMEMEMRWPRYWAEEMIRRAEPEQASPTVRLETTIRAEHTPDGPIFSTHSEPLP